MSSSKKIRSSHENQIWTSYFAVKILKILQKVKKILELLKKKILKVPFQCSRTIFRGQFQEGIACLQIFHPQFVMSSCDFKRASHVFKFFTLNLSCRHAISRGHCMSSNFSPSICQGRVDRPETFRANFFWYHFWSKVVPNKFLTSHFSWHPQNVYTLDQWCRHQMSTREVVIRCLRFWGCRVSSKILHPWLCNWFQVVTFMLSVVYLLLSKPLSRFFHITLRHGKILPFVKQPICEDVN